MGWIKSEVIGLSNSIMMENVSTQTVCSAFGLIKRVFLLSLFLMCILCKFFTNYKLNLNFQHEISLVELPKTLFKVHNIVSEISATLFFRINLKFSQKNSPFLKETHHMFSTSNLS